MVKKIKAKKENCVWFYAEGWRYGKIVKQYSKNRMTVMDCSSKYRIYQNENGKWIAMSNKEFKGQNHIKKEKKNGKKKIRKIKIKKRIKIKITKRKIRKSSKNS